jgi:hypothetical protein
MTSKEFIIWLKGFTEGVHDFNITPKQWDLLKAKIEEVNDHPYSISVGTGGYGTTTFSSGSSNWLSTNTNQNLDND